MDDLEYFGVSVRRCYLDIASKIDVIRRRLDGQAERLEKVESLVDVVKDLSRIDNSVYGDGKMTKRRVGGGVFKARIVTLVGEE